MQFDIDMESKHKNLFLETRKYLLSLEGVKEIKKERITTYSNAKGGLCHLRTMAHGIDIGFLKGVKIVDTMELLTGKGKTLRVLPLKEYNEEIISFYMEQALTINEKK